MGSAIHIARNSLFGQSERASDTSSPPYFDFHLYSVALEIPWRRHTSSVFAPASCSRKNEQAVADAKASADRAEAIAAKIRTKNHNAQQEVE
jgi:hypothetical protein